MDIIVFKAETLNGMLISGSCVIQKDGRLLLANKDSAGKWIECDPKTLIVCGGVRQNELIRNAI
jgi:hypothetical protein